MSKNHLYIVFILLLSFYSRGQEATYSLTLEAAIDSALNNNHLLKAKQLQVRELQIKSDELNIKRLPSVMLSSTYLYNANVNDFEIPAGSLGSIPTGGTPILFPNEAIRIEPMENNLFTAGVNLYQPLSQQWKIHSGQQIYKMDAEIAGYELEQNSTQLRQAIEKLYFGLLINQQEQEVSQVNLELKEIQIKDANQAVESGKAIDITLSGMLAAQADEKQKLLKLQIQEADYRNDFVRLTGLQSDNFALISPEMNLIEQESVDSFIQQAISNNSDLKIATAKEEKASLAIKAGQQSYIPDLGVIAGYMYQQGTILLPENNAFVGINFKWNLQDILLTKKEIDQRKLLLEQAKEYHKNASEEVTIAIVKADRTIQQYKELTKVAEQAMNYRKAAYLQQEEALKAGKTTESQVLLSKSQFIKAQSDWYSAILGYRLSLLEMEALTK